MDQTTACPNTDDGWPSAQSTHGLTSSNVSLSIKNVTTQDDGSRTMSPNTKARTAPIPMAATPATHRSDPAERTALPNLPADGVEPVTDQVTQNANPTSEVADDVERQGRRWLIWSFILCPCHLPVTLGILGALVGGGAFGTLLSRDSIVAGVVLTTLYAIGLGIGLRHIRRANKLRSCSTGQCNF